MLEKLIEFYEKEYDEMETLIISEGRPAWVKPRKLVKNSKRRLLGATQFAQVLGIDFEDIKGYFEIYCEKLDLLLDE